MPCARTAWQLDLALDAMLPLLRLLLATGLVLAGAADACTCVSRDWSIDGIKKALSDSSSVFLGRAHSTRIVWIEKGISYKKVTEFSIVKSWKGPPALYIEVSCRACCIDFEENAEYLVFASKVDSDDSPVTSLCSHSRDRDLADPVIQALDEITEDGI